MYEKGDETAPFFTEAYLYNLLGKEDARSVLGQWNKIKKVVEAVQSALQVADAAPASRRTRK